MFAGLYFAVFLFILTLKHFGQPVVDFLFVVDNREIKQNTRTTMHINLMFRTWDFYNEIQPNETKKTELFMECILFLGLSWLSKYHATSILLWWRTKMYYNWAASRFPTTGNTTLWERIWETCHSKLYVVCVQKKVTVISLSKDKILQTTEDINAPRMCRKQAQSDLVML